MSVWLALRTRKTLRSPSPSDSNEISFVTINEITCCLPFLNWCVFAFGLVEQLTARDSSEDLAEQQSLLLLNLLQNAFVFLCTSREIRKDLVNWTVRNIFVGRITSLTFFFLERSRRLNWVMRCYDIDSPNGIVI